MNEGKPTDRATALRTWLMKAPRPTRLQAFISDGRELEIILRQGVPWSETAISVAATNPERLEAYSSEGNMLRACVVSDLVAKEEKTEALKQSAFVAMQTTDPETQRLIVFAELLQRTADKAIDCVRETSANAYDRLAALAESAERRADTQAENALQLSIAIRNLMIEHAQETVEQATKPEQGPLETLAQNFLAGQQMGEAERAATAAAEAGAKPNGKGKH